MEANQIFFFKNQEKKIQISSVIKYKPQGGKKYMNNFRKIQENCADSKCNEISLMEQKGYQKNKKIKTRENTIYFK